MSSQAKPAGPRWGVTWGRVGTGLLLLIAISAVVLEVLPVHYYATAPGSALPVAPKVKVPGYPPIHSRGHLYMVDATVAPVNHVLEELYWRIQPNVQLDPAQEVAGNLSPSQFIDLNAQMMKDSIRKAEVAALGVARGYKLRFKRGGPEVIFVDPKLPAAAYLRSGDIVRAVDGYPTQSAADVSRLIKRHRPGQIVKVTVDRHGARRVFHIPTTGSTNGVPKKNGKTAIIGVESEDRVALPLKISIDPGNIVGPSAGLMFSLAIVQRLEKKDLTKGCQVAGTGEIYWDGSVLPIGAARQKVAAAEDAGAQYFLVPDTPDNVNPARAGARSIKVVPVKSLRQALQFLNHLKPCR